ncbi:transcriptional regulator [Methanocella sp. CWC-04]|uniref:Transcriptional regulator n=1 Tax=Methanooceanicella nereidis TaxID=2052831 RepID=A0AAP2W6M3_9EURY|nr:helix-turn-helix domain-containing protein [Methanocella sp. CWC-04]MCD1294266.1 transcriptional regulator [Methanocella sp. CWC-04]
MMLDEKMLDTLQRMGLTYYGASAYMALVEMGPSAAARIAEESGVPRSKIYEVLKRLEEENWVKVEKGRPLTYKANHPRDTIEERKSILYSDIDYASTELSRVYEHHIEKDAPKVWQFRGMDNILSRELDMMSRAKQEIIFLGALYSPEEIDQIKKHMSRAKRKGISVRIITRPALSLKDRTVDLVKEFSPVVPDIKLLKTPFIKFVVIDGKEILIMFSKVSEDVPDLDNVVAIWTPNRDIASLMQSNFNMMWGIAEPVEIGAR